MSDQADRLKAKGARRRILIVGMHTSVHVARWLTMIDRNDATLLVFPVYEATFQLPSELRYVSLSEVSKDLDSGLWVVNSTDIHRKHDTFIDLFHGYHPWRHSFLGNTMIA